MAKTQARIKRKKSKSGSELDGPVYYHGRRQDKFSSTASNIQKIAISGVLLALVVSGGVYAVNKVVKDVKKNTASKDTLEYNSPENLATQIRNGFINDNWPGTDEDLIFEAFEQMPTQSFYQKVRIAYTRLFKPDLWQGLTNDLAEDLTVKLSSSEQAKISKILNSKPV